jgi:hypothetical protein
MRCERIWTVTDDAHMLHQSAFIEFAPIPKKEIQGLGNKPVSAYGKGTVLLTSRIDKHVTKIRLNDTLYVPKA